MCFPTLADEAGPDRRVYSYAIFEVIFKKRMHVL